MCKDIIISVLAAIICTGQWYQEAETWPVIMGLSILIFGLCIYLEELYDMYQVRRRRIKYMKNLLAAIAQIRRGT